MMRKIRHIATLALAIAMCCQLSAQTVDSRFLERMESARKLYINGSYFAAEKAFMQLGDAVGPYDDFDRAEIEAYKVLCAIALDKVNVAGMVKVFCDKYPNAPQQWMVKYAFGSRLFDTGKYKEALEVFDTIRKEHVYRQRRDNFEFRRAYCNMRTGNLDKAAEGYAVLVDGEYSRYTIPSTYYLGYVHYCRKEFDQAVPLLEKAASDPRFGTMSRYYAVESKFMLGDYDYVIQQGAPFFQTLSGDLQVNMARILSEAYYEKNENSLAQYYLDIYGKGSKSFSRKDDYFSGMLSYNLGNFKNAITSFGRVMSENDELCQSAHYYTANSHLKNRNKVAAMSEFKAAADMDFDKVIQEDAWFNFAKLSFDVNSDISQFGEYMKLYPDSGKGDVISNYMAASFLLSNDYVSAVKALSNVKRHTNESSANLQKAAFFAAMQMIDNGGWRSAADYLKLALNNDVGDGNLNRLADYWLAECCYHNEDYATAIEVNKALVADAKFGRTAEYPLALYNLAYSYFKVKDYSGAREAFRKYLDGGVFGKGFKHDARVRLADTYYFSDEYAEAAPMYEEIYEDDYMTGDVYPAIQASRAYGQLGNSQKRIAILKAAGKNSRNSRAYPQTMFELGCAYSQCGQNNEASECFYIILGMENDSTYYARSLMELANINVSTKRYERAIEYYKEIIEDVAYAPEAQDAIVGLESVYQTLNRPEDFLAYIDAMGMSDLKTAGEKEEMIFNAAEKLYAAKRYGSAVNAFQRFLTQYPDGPYVLRATLHLGECLENTGRLEAAADVYRKVASGGNGEYAEAATDSYGRIALDLRDYEGAVEAYDALVTVASTDSRKNNAYLGRMRANYGAKRYRDVIRDATYLIGAPSVSPAVVREARFRMAKSQLVTGERNYAQPVFADLARNLDDDFGAESKYLLVQWAFDQGDFLKVESLVYEFASANPPHQYWLAKSFIVLGDSYRERDDFQQARNAYETLRDGYVPEGDSDDILEQLNIRLKQIKTRR